MFIRTSELPNRVTIAAKDTSRRVKQVTLDPTFHTTLMRTAIKAISPSHSVASIKEALFIFLISIINGKASGLFFQSCREA